jgi:hypothetical protein
LAREGPFSFGGQQQQQGDSEMKRPALIAAALAGVALLAGIGAGLGGQGAGGPSVQARTTAATVTAAPAADPASIEFHACVKGKTIRYDRKDKKCSRGYERIGWFKGSADPAPVLSVEYVTESAQPATGQATATATAPCPAAYPYLLGGGGSGPAAESIQASAPLMSVPGGSGIPEGPAGNGWTVTARAVNATDTVTATAICAK